MQDPDTIQKTVKNWLNDVIIDLQLCPFAKKTLSQKSIRFAVTPATTDEVLLQALQDEFKFLAQNDHIETSLLIHPSVLTDFYEYNQFLNVVDALLTDLSLDGIFQIASFHPQYQFADTDQNDAENYSNRSPYPLLHILRERSVSLAVNSYPDIHAIPEQNIRTLNALGEAELSARLTRCFQ